MIHTHAQTHTHTEEVTNLCHCCLAITVCGRDSHVYSSLRSFKSLSEWITYRVLERSSLTKMLLLFSSDFYTCNRENTNLKHSFPVCITTHTHTRTHAHTRAHTDTHTHTHTHTPSPLTRDWCQVATNLARCHPW